MTFEEHFVAGLYSVGPSLPIHLWERILPQVEITLNILPTSPLYSPRTRRLQQNSLFSSRMQNHCPGETRKAASLGSSRAEWIFTWSHHASLPVSKCIHFDNGQRMHLGYSRILSPQISTITFIFHQPITNGSQGHDGRFTESSSCSPIRQRQG
jgi:hypothetical protein